MTNEQRAADESVRFERFDTIDIALGNHCQCWKHSLPGPFLMHPAGCLCLCHGGRREG